MINAESRVPQIVKNYGAVASERFKLRLENGSHPEGSCAPLDGKVEKLALDIISAQRKNMVTLDGSPSGWAAGAVVKACFLLGYRRWALNTNVADTAGVTETCLRKRRREFSDQLMFVVRL